MGSKSSKQKNGKLTKPGRSDQLTESVDNNQLASRTGRTTEQTDCESLIMLVRKPLL